jgi:hypothetical protein
MQDNPHRLFLLIRHLIANTYICNEQGEQHRQHEQRSKEVLDSCASHGGMRVESGDGERGHVGAGDWFVMGSRRGFVVGKERNDELGVLETMINDDR